MCKRDVSVSDRKRHAKRDTNCTRKIAKSPALGIDTLPEIPVRCIGTMAASRLRCTEGRLSE